MRFVASRITAHHSLACRFFHTHQRYSSSWTSKVSFPDSQVQTYISNSRDPFVNLSIEHFLFQKSPPASKVLFLYTNRPCVVIGRNQNPWLEVNLDLLQPKTTNSVPHSELTSLGNVDLVRRRSGGGTVFHDEGNVNWSVICDFADFTRDKHAEMVVRSLRGLGIDRARVNERHDIVLDQGLEKLDFDKNDTHQTPYTSKDASLLPLKVSGSAYKLSRNRALHHGTALLQSPNLHIIPHYLHSPAKSFISAKGVGSVSSPVGNIGITNSAFEDAVQAEFMSVYGNAIDQAEQVDEGSLEHPEIRKGYDELRSPDWTFCQTPQFTFSNYPINTENPEELSSAIPDGKLSMNVRYGVIKDCEWTPSGKQAPNAQLSKLLNDVFAARKLHEIGKWTAFENLKSTTPEFQQLGAFLNSKLSPLSDHAV